MIKHHDCRGSSAAASGSKLNTVSIESGIELIKKVTSVLLVYALLVIASCIFWVWYAMSKSKLTVGGNRGDTHVVADIKKTKQDAEKIADKTSELTGGEVNKVDVRLNDIAKSNDL